MRPPRAVVQGGITELRYMPQPYPIPNQGGITELRYMPQP